MASKIQIDWSFIANLLNFLFIISKKKNNFLRTLFYFKTEFVLLLGGSCLLIMQNWSKIPKQKNKW